MLFTLRVQLSEANLDSVPNGSLLSNFSNASALVRDQSTLAELTAEQARAKP
jgi:hypothetical protein